MHPKDDPRARPIELGASVFVAANQNMMKAAKVGMTFTDTSNDCAKSLAI